MAIPLRTGTLVIPRDIGIELCRNGEHQLISELANRLQQPVFFCSVETSRQAFAEGFQAFAEQRCRRITVLPVGLSPVTDRYSLRTMEQAIRQWPDLEIFRAAPATWQEWSRWLHAMAVDACRTLAINPVENGVLIVGRNMGQPQINANLARLMHLLRETQTFGWVDYALLDGPLFNIPAAVPAFVKNGIRQVIVLPWLLDSVTGHNSVKAEVQQIFQRQHIATTLIAPMLHHSSVVNLFVVNCLAADRWSSGEKGFTTETLWSSASSPPAELSTDDLWELEELERRINSLLPREYQGRYEDVSPRSMGTAELKYDSQGQVAWGEIWTSFCDLALAGGPPHRGSLLEAVTAEEALADPVQYQAVVSEIERGISLVTSLPVVTSRTAGWVGVRCENEEMAVWLMRAIIVENIMVRREHEVLFLPAGPRFTVKREIKNVITVIAKTVHYWKAHLISSNR